MKKKLFIGLAIVMFLIGTVCSVNATLIANEDFETEVVGWNDTKTEAEGVFTRFLGRHSGSLGAQSLYKDYALSGNQTDVIINFDFYEINSWDNWSESDRFLVYVDNVVVREDSYSHGSYDTPVGVQNLSGSNTDLGFPGSYDGYAQSYNDQMLRYTLNIATTATSLRLGFGTFLDEPIGNESWGIDNVLITSNATSAPVPEPATMLLLSTGLVSMAGVMRRKTKK